MELTHTAARPGRLSTFLKNELHMSSGLINRLKWQDKIFVNGIPRHNDWQVSAGDVITVPLDEPTPDYPAEEGELTVLYEDEHILAVDKPAGMLIHPSRATNTGTLANRVLGYYQKTGQKSAFHPITRLDRDTFGVVLLAKNAHVHALLNDLQEAGCLEKTYEALVYGGPEADSGSIHAPIARRPLPSLLRYVNQNGKPSHTEYRVLQRMEGYSRLALVPVTGRTHQLRVHCAHMGFPILGDPQYGTEESQQLSARLNLHHQHLCATTLIFPHPITGIMLTVNTKAAR
ncbi:MAG: RluA family pseudouridine synthase [Oscillospiraceae bacterium]|nr:RluA family pseudouridine synthase [Oscillospiraceae bacterium]